MSHDSAPREYICGESRPSVATLLNSKSWPRTSESTWERPGQKGEPPAHVVYVADTRRLYGALRGSVLHMAPFSAQSERRRREFLEVAEDARLRLSLLYDMERELYIARNAEELRRIYGPGFPPPT